MAGYSAVTPRSGNRFATNFAKRYKQNVLSRRMNFQRQQTSMSVYENFCFPPFLHTCKMAPPDFVKLAKRTFEWGWCHENRVTTKAPYLACNTKSIINQNHPSLHHLWKVSPDWFSKRTFWHLMSPDTGADPGFLLGGLAPLMFFFSVFLLGEYHLF